MKFLLALLMMVSLSSSWAQRGQFTSLKKALAMPDSVQSLVLRHKGLKEWPKELGQFPNLKELDLAHNSIRRVPDSVGCCTQLQRLDLTGNKLDSLGAFVSSLSQLKVLRVGNNNIYHVHSAIGKCSQLQVLEIWSNNIYYLPIECSDLKSLTEVDVRGIQLSENHQESIRNLFEPSVKVRFSQSCACD